MKKAVLFVLFALLLLRQSQSKLPGIRVTLKKSFFKGIINDFNEYLMGLKQGNSVCFQQDTGKARIFKLKTPLITVSYTCSNFTFKDIGLNNNTSGVQFINSTNKVRLLLYEVLADFSFDFQVQTKPWSIFNLTNGSVEARLDKLNFIIEMGFYVHPENLLGLGIRVERVDIYRNKVQFYSLKITTNDETVSHDINSKILDLLQCCQEGIDSFLSAPLKKFLQTVVRELFGPRLKERIDSHIAQTYGMAINLNIIERPEIQTDYMNLPLQGAAGPVGTTPTLHVKNYYIDANFNIRPSPVEILVSQDSLENIITAVYRGKSHTFSQFQGKSMNLAELEALLGVNIINRYPVLRPIDSITATLQLPSNFSRTIQWIMGDLYLTNFNPTLNFQVRNRTKAKLKDLFQVQLTIASLADLDLSNKTVTGVLHFFKIRSHEVESLIPSLLSNKTIQSKLSSLGFFDQSSIKQTLQNELNQGITIDLIGKVLFLEPNYLIGEVMNTYIIFETSFSVDFASLVSYIDHTHRIHGALFDS